MSNTANHSKGRPWKKVKGFSSILFRTAMLAWLVSIASICIFAFYIIPQQKQVFLDVLESKARVLTSSIHDVAASAFVTEDYSEVVDHCLDIIMNNPSVSYIVLTRKDGFSLVHKQDGWRIDNLGGYWKNGFGERAGGSIRSSGLVDQDTYHYTSTMDFSGLDWGKAHIGLSLEQYHAGVNGVYKRTAFVAVLCIAVGLVVSLVYASRLVKPILALENAVHSVAEGDLEVRADIHSGDEVESLSNAFNAMTQSIQDREALGRAQKLQLTALATEKALHAGDIAESARRICEASAETFGVERVGVWLFNEDESEMECLGRYSRNQWVHAKATPCCRKGNESYFAALEGLRVMAISNVHNDPRTSGLVGSRISPDGTLSIIDAAIRVGGHMVGVITQEHIGSERVWTVEEENFAGSLADLMALALEARDRRSARDELLAAKEAAEAASEAKSQFLANMSHEIRTPLNGVVGMLKLLRESPLNPKQQRFVNKGIISSEALLVVINDVLDFSKIEAGKLEIESVPFNLVDITENVAQMFAQRAEEKSLELVCFIHNDVPRMVIGDPNRIGQVLINLVGNAIKFTERGDVVVRARLEQEEDDGTVIRFEVKDTGVGISLEKKERIFEAFMQEDSSTTRRFGGTGLGLGISRQLVRLMGGQLHVESRPGFGSTFWFTVRLGNSALNAAAHERPQSMQGLNALVVDDHAINREILCHELDSWGCKTTEASDGQQALELLQERASKGTPIDLAVIDWKMPGLNGEELGRRIKMDTQLQDTALVMLSSVYGMDTAHLRDVGFSAYLSKPARQSELYDAILNSINEAPDAMEAAAKPQDGKEIDAERIRILLAEDNEINQEVAIEILKMSGYNCDVVNNGRKAVEAVQSGGYHLLFMDCMMPEMDGYEATQAIRVLEKETGRHLPIVAMTANAMKGDREACLDAGMDDYLSKPLDPLEIQTVVEKWCSGVTVGEEPAVVAEGRVDAGAIFDREQLLNRCMGNEVLVDKLVEKFLVQVDEDIRGMEKGLAAKELGAVIHCAHRIKGASANMGMETIRAISAEAECCARLDDLEEASIAFERLKAEVVRVSQYLKMPTAEMMAG